MPTSVVEPLLNVSALESGYGKIRVLHGIDMTIAAGEVVALLGDRKSTRLNSSHDS